MECGKACTCLVCEKPQLARHVITPLDLQVAVRNYKLQVGMTHYSALCGPLFNKDPMAKVVVRQSKLTSVTVGCTI